MVDLMSLLSDALIGSFQMFMLNDFGKNMFPYRIKTCWKRILIYGVTALVILSVNHIESTFINIMMIPVSYTIASIVIFQGSVWKKIILACCYYMLAIVPEFLFAVITGAYGVTGTENNFLLNLTVFQRQQKNTGKIIGDFTKLLPLNLVFAKEDIWKSAEMVQEQIMKDLDHLSFDGTEIMRELAKRRGVFGKALLPVVFTCVLFDCPENYFERLGSIKYAVSQTPQVFLDNQITEMGGRLHISWDVVDELFEACIIDEIFLEFVEDIKRISENNKANSTNDFVTKVWGNILTKEIITKSVVPDLLKSIDLKQIKILDYAQELCPPDVKGQVYVSESEIMNDRNKTYYKILEHPLYGRMADTGIIGVLTHDGYMEFVVPNCETSVETPDKKEDTHEEEIEKPIVKEIMKIWKEVFEIEDISIQDDFYTLGGDSIILMRLVDEMCKTLGCDVTVDDILQSENISDLANRV